MWGWKVDSVMLSFGISILEDKGEDIELWGLETLGMGGRMLGFGKHISSMSAVAHTQRVNCKT
jgi:hypothetical protein